MSGLTLPARAKINLYLDILKRRPDGYHELLTLFERLDLADEVTVEPVSGREVAFACDSPEVPRDASNLAVRAARAYLKASGWRTGLKIRLVKRIPAAAGMGGGSSDAAAVLTALQRLAPRPLPEKALLACARGLGADVPFFVSGVPFAWGRGRGDEIEPLDLPVTLWHVWARPDCDISTPEVYRACAEPGGGPSLRPPGAGAQLLLRALEALDLPGIRGGLFNALESVVEERYPVVREVKTVVEKAVGPLSRPLLSGSGSSVFAVCGSRAQAEAAAERVRAARPGWRAGAAATGR